jgi:pyruvate/2-oxoglutarate dehydrogenase complex dihydrolipoamide acyltransferase (E2) component
MSNHVMDCGCQEVSQKPGPGYQAIPYPRSRILVADAVRAGKRKPLIHGLVEVDVTAPRGLLREHEARTGEKLSFTGFIVGCVGTAVAEDRMVHAYRDWRNRLILFEDVDINTIIEVELEGRRFPMAHTIRATNRRTLQDIHDEIRRVQTQPRESLGGRTIALAGWFVRLPAFARDLVYRAVLRQPEWLKGIGGTVNVTAVGMFAEGGGWGIPLPLYTLCVTLGGVSRKPVVLDGQIVAREILDLTLTFDHDIVDGAPAARFAGRLKELIESGHGLAQ